MHFLYWLYHISSLKFACRFLLLQSIPFRSDNIENKKLYFWPHFTRLPRVAWYTLSEILLYVSHNFRTHSSTPWEILLYNISSTDFFLYIQSSQRCDTAWKWNENISMGPVNIKMNQSSGAYKNAINFNIVTIFHLNVERTCALSNLFIVQRLKCLTVWEMLHGYVFACGKWGRTKFEVNRVCKCGVSKMKKKRRSKKQNKVIK